MKKIIIVISIFYFSISNSQAQSKDTPSEMIKKCTEMIDRNPDGQLEVTYMARGNAKVELQDYRGAILDFKKAISLMDNECDFCTSSMAQAMMKMKDYPNAILQYSILIEKNKKNGQIWGYNDYVNQRASCKFELNDYRGAILDYDMIIASDPKNSKAYYNRGAAYWNIKQKNNACLDWSKAGELGFTKAYDNIKEVCN